MHKFILKWIRIDLRSPWAIQSVFVLGSRKPNQPFLVDIDPERINRWDESVDSKVILKPVYQMRIWNVSGNNGAVFLRNVRTVLEKFNTSSTRSSAGFEDPDSISVVVLLFFSDEVQIVIGHDEGLRDEGQIFYFFYFLLRLEWWSLVVIFGVEKLVQVSPHQILMSDLSRAGKVVHSLVLIKCLELRNILTLAVSEMVMPS